MQQSNDLSQLHESLQAECNSLDLAVKVGLAGFGHNWLQNMPILKFGLASYCLDPEMCIAQVLG